MKSVLTIVVVLISVLFIGCSGYEAPETLYYAPIEKKESVVFNEPEQLIEYIDGKENGFIKTKTINAIEYSAVLKPSAYLLAQKRLLEKNENLKASDFEDLQYFDIRIAIQNFHSEFIKYNLEDTDEYQRRISYCAFEMQKDIQLIDGKDTLDCVLFHFERAFNVVPYGHFFLGFKPNPGKLISAKTIVFNDHLFNQGLIKFTFPPQLLVNEPTLL